MRKTYLSRRLACTAIITGFLLFFQNCGQPGDLSMIKGPPQNASLAQPQPDPVSLIVSPVIKINNGDPFTKSKNVSLQISAVGAEQMQISNDADCSKASLETYSENKSWVLDSENANTTVYARFQKTGAPTTNCVEASIVHDNIAPTLSVTKKADAVTSLMKVQFQFVAQDSGSGIAAVYCKPAGIAEANCDTIYEFASLTEGSHGLAIRAVDKAGNESAPTSLNFIVDRTAPVISINGPSGMVATPDIKYQISIIESNGLKSVQCRLSPLETAYKDCSSLKSDYKSLASGSYMFEVLATDMAGNASSKSQAVIIDSSVPSVTITKTPLAIGNIKNVAFEFVGISGSKAITKFKCSLDGAAMAACNSPMPYLNLIDKNHSFGVIGTNDVGVDSSVQNYNFIVDTLPPILKITSSPTGITKNKVAVVVLEASDLNGIKSIECTLNGVTSNCSTKTATYDNLPDGNYTFVAKAIDNAGNSTVTAPITWKIDTTADSSIIATMAVNPVKEGTTGTLNITLNQVTGAAYNCKTISGNTAIIAGAVTGNSAAVNFVVNEDISCIVAGKDKNNMDISKTVIAEVGCGNRVKDGNKCVDFKCLSIVNLPYSKKFTIPARTAAGICYSMKLFNSIPNGPSNLTQEIDSEVISRDHGQPGMFLRNPYVLGKDLLNFTLEGKRVAKLSGGANATSPIKVDNYVLVGLYPEAIQPLTSHYSAQGTLDSTVTTAQTHILLNNQAVPLKSFGPSGTATVAPIEIVREADTNLSYMLDLRALDCSGSRELSEIYLLFQ